VAREVVEHHRVSGPEGRDEDLGEVLPEPGAGHRPVEHLGGDEPVGPEGGGERQALVVPVGDGPDDRLAARGVPVPPVHPGVRGRLVGEHDPARVEGRGDPVTPGVAGRPHVRPVPLGGPDDFF
jgi:hypothetical protein